MLCKMRIVSQTAEIYGFLFCLVVVMLSFITYIYTPCQQTPILFINTTDKQKVVINKFIPLIFVGGVPRSGTTLMRALLDAHPDIRCGAETHVIPRLLGMRNDIELNIYEKNRLIEAGINNSLLDSVIENFVLEIIAKHGYFASNLCNKDPITLKSTIYLSYLFPKSKFILMIRDGRAVVHSIITRNVPVSTFDLNDGHQCLRRWSQTIAEMYAQCIRVGPQRCMPVYYEQLVLYKEDWMHRILEFLDIPWNNSVLHHEDFIGKPNGIYVSRAEFSTDQIMKPVNTEALSTWVGYFNDDVVTNLESIAPMLKTLGYDPSNNPPDYINPEIQVRENTLHLKKNLDFWKRRPKNIFDKLPYNSSL